MILTGMAGTLDLVALVLRPLCPDNLPNRPLPTVDVRLAQQVGIHLGVEVNGAADNLAGL